MDLSLTTLVAYLDAYCGSARFVHDQNGVYREARRPVRRLGLALDPWPGIGVWVDQERLDALFLHRPWSLPARIIPSDVGILAYHLAFDLTLTFGFNQRLATVLQLQRPSPFAFQENIPLGMLGDLVPGPLDRIITCLAEIFGISPRLEGDTSALVQRIAIVGAMNDRLVREAAEQGAQLYVTGQIRPAARIAVRETGLVVAEIGHAAGEAWGIRALAGLLRERWSALEVIITPV